MTDKKELQNAFLAGFVSARKAGFTPNELHPVAQRAAETNFEKWWRLSYDN